MINYLRNNLIKEKSSILVGAGLRRLIGFGKQSKKTYYTVLDVKEGSSLVDVKKAFMRKGNLP
jgi:hypothetical protein